jgi:predicted Zn finger-like uncharacterized protein
MTVQCPRCRTQYKIPSARINDPRPVFKCTRCSLVFSSEPERGPRGPARGKEDSNLSLPFASGRSPGGRKADPPQLAGEDDPTVQTDLDQLETDEVEEDVDEELADDGDADEPASSEDDEDDEEQRDAPEPRRRGARARGTSRSRAASASDETVQEPAFVARAARDRERERALADRERAAAERERAAVERERAAAARERERERAARKRAKDVELRLRDDDELDHEGPTSDLADEDDEPRRPVLSASEGKQRRAPINPRRIRSAAATSGGRSPLRPVTIGVASIAIVYVALAVALGRRSEAAIETLSQVPVLGRLLGGDHLLVWRLQLSGVDGGLDQIKGGRPAYVVSGRAVNTTNEDLRVIEIEGRLLANGVEQRRQTVYAANQQRKTIQDLSPSEVEMLLRLEPNRRFVIRPGESASFLLVFPNPPPGTTEVTCRVVNARPA